jgi:tetratricopeptide (TPR) repeat protein
LDGARAALLEYRRLAPKGANPLDSLGDVHFHLGAFRDAEKYYLEAHEKDKAFLGGAELYKAARARLMTGDKAGANDIFQRYAAERSAAQDPLGGYRQAQWLYLTGKRAEAVAALTKLASSPAAPDVLSLAASQLAIWSLLNGNRDEAAAWTGKAVGAAGSPGSRRLAALCLALTGSTPPQGALTAEVAKVAAALRALLAQRFADAVPLLEDRSAAADPVGSDRVGVLLAWALNETGRLQEAAPWLETFGVPPAGLEDPLVYFSFPRVFQLRATALAKQGRQADAAKMREVYRALGDR